MQKKYIVRLTDSERVALMGVVKKLKGSSQKVRRAQILLKADADGPGWTDAKIAEASCLGYLLYLNHQDPELAQAYVAKIQPLLQDLRKSSPDNPRLCWVLGQMYWSNPVDPSGGQIKAFAIYQKGLDSIRQHKDTPGDPLDPSWGEPELLMNLAWSNLNRTSPDLSLAEQEGAIFG